MKKVITGIVISGLVLLTGGGAALATANLRNSAASESLVAIADEGSSTLNVPSQLIMKDETVYLITDQAGQVDKKFIGSSLANTDEALPVKMEISYYLDSDEISASELVGKSGHAKIKYGFTSSKHYQDKLVPFLAVTGVELDGRIFKNIELNNGKVIKESSENTVAMGYSFVGLNENLGTDFLPGSFSIEADVENFELGTTYTLVTNEVFADLDTSKLNTIDEVVGQMNQLASGLDQIIDGSSSLASGLDSALDGAKKLQAGTGELNAGAAKLAAGAGTINSGLHELAAGATRLSDGLDSVVTVNNEIMSKVDAVSAVIQTKTTDVNNIIVEIAETDPELAGELATAVSELSGYYDQAYSAVNEYVSGIEQLAGGAEALENGANVLVAGTDELASGATALANGASELNGGTVSLVDGLGRLVAGSKTLNSGLNTFKEQGTNKLVDFANRDLNAFARNLRLSVEAAKSYRSYGGVSAKSVKFVFKMPAIR